MQDCTFADHDNHAMALQGVDPASSISHCIFDNAGTDISTNVAIPIMFCAFAHSSFPGKGNLSMTDPRLDRPYCKLLPASPCIDAGDPAGTLGQTDYEGDARRQGSAADIGADEYVPSGSVHVFGARGQGEQGMMPAIGTANGTLRIGETLRVHLSGCRDRLWRPAFGAVLVLGFDEGDVTLPRSLWWAGAPGSMIWCEPETVVVIAAPLFDGAASASVGIPNVPALVGETMTLQWFAGKADANAAGLVSSDGLRATIGQ
ncbi:MAG: hypothetical protein Fur0037_06830 [Planctomycetota bacterium]